MSEQPMAAKAASFPPTDERYDLVRLLGLGGMAVVYEAQDRPQKRSVALKRLQAVGEAERQRRNLELFEREYHTLSQLAHPRIIQVYDFGIDASGAYYTMELLQGGDLQQLAPLPWRRACAIARDVCSALSLLHSRRLVHRDVSPRNVRCLPDGPAKLIDFGALVPMGTSKLIVGTPPCCAPESVQFQSLDGRTDLFALGATLYFVLVGHHAYPARQFGTLQESWRAGFRRPSEIVSDIPEALDALVVELLRIEPDARPATAAEVSARLSAIDGVVASEGLLTARAYLSTPTLVGRDAQLERVRRRVKRASAGRSRSVLIEGAAGVGRTRFLDACLLDATMAGCIVVRADADDAVSGDYGVARVIARHLLERVPQATLDAARPVLAQIAGVIPQLATDPLAAAESSGVAIPRARIQEGLRAWLATLSRSCSLIIGIDDFHRIDEPSAALLALLEHDSSQHELCLLISTETGALWTAESTSKLLKSVTTIKLESLSSADAELLVRSLFGVTRNSDVFAHRLYAVCAGNPRATLSLAQHLVDRGIARYEAGAWLLPDTIDEVELPASLSQALSARIDRLSAPARQLACALALCPDQSLSFEECAQVAEVRDPAAWVAELDKLVSAEIVRRVGDEITLAQRAWAPLLQAKLTFAAKSSLERALAMQFERRGKQEFRAAQHWFRAHEPGRALDLLVAHAKASQESTARGPEIFLAYLLTLPNDWFDTFELGLSACIELGRPRRYEYTLLSRLVGITSLLNTHAGQHMPNLFRQLSHDSGLDDWAELPRDLEPKDRFMRAIAIAQDRYKQADEHDRVLDPITAIRHLARAVVSAIGGVTLALDVERLRQMPDLAPFAALSPALEASYKLVAGVDARCSGRLPRARIIYRELLALLERPDRAGLDPSHAEYVVLGVMNGLGMIEAGLGLASGLDWAERIERSSAYAVNACVIRRLHRLFQGDIAGAEAYKQAADRLRIQYTGRQMYEGGHLLWEVQVHAMSADLTRIRQVSEEIAPLAKRYPHWEPVLRYATAEYHRVVRDPTKACAELERVLATTAAGFHQIWIHAATAYVSALVEAGRPREAVERGRALAALAEQELGYLSEHLQIALATANAHCGDAVSSESIGDAASPASVADAAIERLQQSGVAGLRLGNAYEARARIALRLEDTAGFARHVELCRELYMAHKNSSLIARYHRLVHEGSRRFDGVSEAMVGTPDSAAQYSGSRVELALASCRDDEQRARLALTILIRQSGAVAGLYFGVSAEGPVCLAQLGGAVTSAILIERVRAYLAQHTAGSVTAHTQTDAESEVAAVEIVDDAGRAYNSILIRHFEHAHAMVTGLAVLRPAEHQSLSYPGEAAIAISRYLSSHGATSLMLLADD